MTTIWSGESAGASAAGAGPGAISEVLSIATPGASVSAARDNRSKQQVGMCSCS